VSATFTVRCFLITFSFPSYNVRRIDGQANRTVHKSITADIYIACKQSDKLRIACGFACSLHEFLVKLSFPLEYEIYRSRLLRTHDLPSTKQWSLSNNINIAVWVSKSLTERPCSKWLHNNSCSYEAHFTQWRLCNVPCLHWIRSPSNRHHHRSREESRDRRLHDLCSQVRHVLPATTLHA